jgi:hypothetical protein
MPGASATSVRHRLEEQQHLEMDRLNILSIKTGPFMGAVKKTSVLNHDG